MVGFVLCLLSWDSGGDQGSGGLESVV